MTKPVYFTQATLRSSTSRIRSFRWASLFLTSAGLAAGIFGVSNMFAPSVGRAETPTKPLIASAEDGRTKAGAASSSKPITETDPELAKLPRGSVERMRQLDKESAVYRPSKFNGELDGVYIAMVKIPLENGGTLIVEADLCRTKECTGNLPAKRAVVRLVDVPGVENETKYGTYVAVVDLEPLAHLFKRITGKEMKAVKLIVEKGEDSSVGKYIQVHVFPQGSPSDDIGPAIPAIVIPFTVRDHSTWKDRLTLLAMN